MKHDFKVDDGIIVVKPEHACGIYDIGSIGVIKSIDDTFAPFNIKFPNSKGECGLYLSEFVLYKPNDNWIPFKGGKCPVDYYTKVLVQYYDGEVKYSDAVDHTLVSNGKLWTSEIVAYQVIVPYNPPREKVIYENKKEMLSDLISRGKLYLNKEGEEHIYFNEDARYTIGYVMTGGREEIADRILEALELWV